MNARWTNHMVARLERMWRSGADNDAPLAAFPGLGIGQLKSKARALSLPTRPGYATNGRSKNAAEERVRRARKGLVNAWLYLQQRRAGELSSL